MQSLVTTPQDIALLDARKALKMFEKVEIPVLGVVENMSTHVCSQCGHEEAIFGQGGGRRMAEEYSVDVLGGIPSICGFVRTPIVVGRRWLPTRTARSAQITERLRDMLPVDWRQERETMRTSFHRSWCRIPSFGSKKSLGELVSPNPHKRREIKGRSTWQLSQIGGSVEWQPRA